MFSNWVGKTLYMVVQNALAKDSMEYHAILTGIDQHGVYLQRIVQRKMGPETCAEMLKEDSNYRVKPVEEILGLETFVRWFDVRRAAVKDGFREELAL